MGRPLVHIIPQPFLYPDSDRPSFPSFASHAQPDGCRMVFPMGSGLKSVCVFVCVRQRMCVCTHTHENVCVFTHAHTPICPGEQ